MTNLISKTKIKGNLTTITKSFKAKTPNGLDIIISAWREIIGVTETPHKTKTHFSLYYNDNEIGHYRMDKDALKYYIDFIDKWSHKL